MGYEVNRDRNAETHTVLGPRYLCFPGLPPLCDNVSVYLFYSEK